MLAFTLPAHPQHALLSNWLVRFFPRAMVAVDSDVIDKVSGGELESSRSELYGTEFIDILGNGLVEKKVFLSSRS